MKLGMLLDDDAGFGARAARSCLRIKWRYPDSAFEGEKIMLRVGPNSDILPPEEASAHLAAARQIEAGRTLPTALPPSPDPTRFGYLFPELQTDPANLLPECTTTVQALRDLGESMREPKADSALDSGIPSAYTYFGQFVDHDITLMVILKKIKLNDPNLVPLSPAELGLVKNVRTPLLDLDSVYAEAPHAGDDFMLLGTVTKTGHRPPRKEGDEFDLPRADRSSDPARDRVARVGDGRNDENTMVSQLHVAFLRAHNAIVAGGYDYCKARSLLRRYYHLIIIHDFLKRVADPTVVDDMLSKVWGRFNPSDDDFFMPLEFAAAAFRFGHSMVRRSYDVNARFPADLASLFQLFNVIGPYASLPEEWIIQWENFVEGGTNKARLIDTQLVAPLFTIPHLPPGDEIRLAVRTLLRGYLLRLPTGQAVAGALGLHVMIDKEIEEVASELKNTAQLDELRKERPLKSGSTWKLSGRTPLWFYILAEAWRFEKGMRLGPVGSHLVAGVLIGLIRRSKDSVLQIPGWTPSFGSTFKLPDLLRLARVL